MKARIATADAVDALIGTVEHLESLDDVSRLVRMVAQP